MVELLRRVDATLQEVGAVMLIIRLYTDLLNSQ